jgi:hypothetical protein
MRPIAGSASLVALLLATGFAYASSSLVLTDGQVIKGTEITRQGDSYLVTMVGGNTVAFPAALVKEIKFEDDPPPPAPAGFDYSGPKTLAGPTLPQPAPDNGQQVFGPPTQWSKSAVDTTVQLTNAFDPNADVMAGSRSTWSKSAVDTTVVLKDAYDPNVDVMAATKSTWSKNAVDTTWKPTDGFGFKALSFKGTSSPATTSALGYQTASTTPYVTTSETASQTTGPAPWDCAENFFVKDADRPATEKDNQSPSLSLKSVKSPLYASLGLPLYEATGTLDGTPRKAVFTIADGSCRLVGGDADALIGLNLTSEHAMAQDAAAFNVAMASRGGARIPPGVDKVDYALAFVSLTDPLVSGSKGVALKLLATPEELRSIEGKTGGVCTLSKGKRRKEDRAATKAFALPKIAAGKDGDVVTFLTWSSAGGMVYRETVVLARGGVVSVKRDIVASHVGVHQD